VLRTDPYERAHLLESDPEVFYLTDHYRDHPYILVRLPRAGADLMRPSLADAWRRVAPARLVARYDAG
jgi:hypothetical protein